ncbi:MAG: thiamine pyrophosphate-dependent enzyme [Cyclobacteriaceae bacterium]
MTKTAVQTLPANLTIEDIISDYALCIESRETSVLGRKEVFMGKAKFGIFGAGKEVPQVAAARFFKKGDIRSGYYRDQTFMFATGMMTPEQLFAQLYADPDIEREVVSSGRLMTGHFGTQMLDQNGKWKPIVNEKHSTTDVSPTAAQMPRALGVAYASSLFRNNKKLNMKNFSVNGNEVSWAMIGNASTSEGMFFETVNAAGVLQVPLLISVWDDDFGISVPGELQTTKGNISEVLKGFQQDNKGKGYEIIEVKGWDYAGLIEAYQKAEQACRKHHIPALVHVTEVTQPQGHSTSGSHERYKSAKRLEWEKTFDCIPKMRKWILENGFVTSSELDQVEKSAKEKAKQARNSSWKAYQNAVKKEVSELDNILNDLKEKSPKKTELEELITSLHSLAIPLRSNTIRSSKKAIRLTKGEKSAVRTALLDWNNTEKKRNHVRYSSFLYSDTDEAAIKVKEVPATYDKEPELVDGRVVLQRFFDIVLSKDQRIFALGEDVGKIGDVNQGFAGLQEKHGDLRVTDTGIRECTIIGQAIGAAMRGLRPIAEIQYVDYIMYAIQLLTDDLATIRYRSFGKQKAPVIIRTRGHRLEGVWHSGSPLGSILNMLRGIYVCVPRNMTQAAGMYNTLLHGDDPGLVIECLNGYRLKEPAPTNLGKYTVPLGVPEVLKEGNDITVVTYGSMCRIVMDAAQQLEQVGIHCEVIDIQTMLPFDVNHRIVESLKKTNRILFADEDIPGGATAFMMQQVLEEQSGYFHLDSKPKTISSWAHRPAYGDGDYFSKPNAEDVFDYIYDMFNETDSDSFPSIYE